MYCVRMDVINLTTKQTKKIDYQTAEQARCERWEKEAVVVVDDDVFLTLLSSLL